MKIVLYQEDGKVIDTIENVLDPVVDTRKIEWTGGALEGINAEFLLLDDTITVTDTVSEELISLDKKHLYKKIDLAKENEQLKERLKLAEDAILSLMNFM